MSTIKRERWAEADVDALPRDEHDYFDRKSGLLFEDRGELLATLAKAVSAFANSGGGYLVLGVDDDGLPDGVPTLVGRTPIREWLEQQVPNLVSPPIADFRVHVVEHSTHTRIAAQREVIVIEVGDSLLAPHQCAHGGRGVTKGLYYYRQAGHSVAAPHFYLELLRSRRTRPELQLRLQEHTGRLADDDSRFDIRADFEVVNVSQVTASFAVISLALPPTTNIDSPVYNAWKQISNTVAWTIVRSVMAAGSWQEWSPITPGFTLVADHATFRIDKQRPVEGRERTIGLARLDHDGGMSLHRIDLYPHQPRLQLEPFPGNMDPELIERLKVPDIFMSH